MFSEDGTGPTNHMFGGEKKRKKLFTNMEITVEIKIKTNQASKQNESSTY